MKTKTAHSVAWLLLALFLAAGLTPLATGQARTGTVAPQQKQAIDEAYTAKIREYTTDKHFLTEMVDHLPASATVPTPEKVLGYVIGTPNKLTYSKDVNRYFRELAKATPRVKVWVAGKSEEGREMLLVAISDDANMAKLDRYKEITAKLADPRKITDAEADALIAEGKPIYWLSGAIHSPETGSPEMLMELAYRLAVSEAALIKTIRSKAIVLITPVLEVDGRDRRVDTYNYQKANPDKPAPGLVYWGKYVAHDNNRDSIAMSLELSKAQMRNFLEWRPQVLHDLHESVPFLYVSTGTGPYNAWLDPIVVSEWQKLANHEVEEMTKRGVPGVWTHGFYDGWAPNYMFYVANGHNSIGRFYETYGGTGADTRMRRVGPAQTSRTWFRPNPPLPRTKWSIRNNVNLQQSGVILAISYTASNGAEFLRNFYLKSKRSVAKGTTEGPAAWIIRSDKRPQLAGQLANLMQRQGAEVHRLDADFEMKAEPSAADPASRTRAPRAASATDESAGEQPAASEEGQASGAGRRRAAPQPTKIPQGSYVVRMDQPYSRMVDMLLDTQFYSTADPRPYDDTGWTLGPLRNVETNRVTDVAILKAPMTLVSDQIRASGKITGTSATKYYVVNATAEPALATLRFRLKDVKFFAAQEAFEADGKKFNAGSFLIPTEGNPSDLRAQLGAATAELGMDAHATDADIKAKRHAMKLPRIALMHTWVNTQNEGWFRLALEETGVPYAYISDQDVRGDANLKSKYDVILFPPVTSNISTLINGVRKRVLDDGSDFGGPIPWKNSELTPNLAGNDETDDIRGGLGFAGLANLKKFIEDGGVFIPITASTSLPIELGITEGVSIETTRQLAARGSIVNATVEDKASPIAYGYDDKLSVYFNQAPVLRVSIAGGGGGGGGGGATGGARTAGRGSSTDPDIPQGRPWEAPEREPRRNRAEQETYIDPDIRAFLAGSILPQRMWPRVVLRFAPAASLWVSGMLEGGSELAEAPAVIDVPVGRGHVVLFATNPMWRHETHGSFMLLLNAAMHFDNLKVGRVAKPDAASEKAAEELGGTAQDGHNRQ